MFQYNSLLALEVDLLKYPGRLNEWNFSEATWYYNVCFGICMLIPEDCIKLEIRNFMTIM